jgi:dTDP-4-dehydrorhamnose reductase
MGRSADQVTAVSTAQLDPPRPAPRPANSVLDNAALRAWGVEAAPDFRDSLPALVAKLCV